MTDRIVETTVNGIETLLAPRSAGRIVAGLMFRVGRADETLARSGITHLVEHLALHEHGLGDLHYNGATDDTVTHFHVEGSEEHVVEYLNGVCRALRELPLHRLETEKEILRTEAASRSRGPAPDLSLYRYGAASYGLSSYDELGLHALTAADVSTWARERFTSENAVLWITSDRVPDGLDLSLRSGRRLATPEPTSALPVAPAWFGAPIDMVVAQAVVPRSTAANLFSRVLAKALFRDLRQIGGYSYQATADYLPRDATHALVLAAADCLPEKREAVVGGLVDCLARLHFGTIEDSELGAAKAAARAMFDTPDLPAALLPSTALNRLLGAPEHTAEELLAEIEATTVADLDAVAAAVWSDLLVQVPALGLDWAGFTEAPQVSVAGVHGQSFASLDTQTGPLVIGHEGVTLEHANGPITVRYDELVAVQEWPDGGRRLIGSDGFSIPVEPTLHALDADALDRVVRHLPPSLVVPMPARASEQIPAPAAAPAGNTSPSTLGRLWRIFLGVVVVFFFLNALSGTYDQVTGRGDIGWGGVVVLWLLVAVSAWGFHRKTATPADA